MMDDKNKFIDTVKKIVYTVLGKENLLGSRWHMGKVDSIIDSKHIRCFIDGNTTSVIISANPDVVFASGDEIYVIFNSVDKFALCKRGTI